MMLGHNEENFVAAGASKDLLPRLLEEGRELESKTMTSRI